MCPVLYFSFFPREPDELVTFCTLDSASEILILLILLSGVIQEQDENSWASTMMVIIGYLYLTLK